MYKTKYQLSRKKAGQEGVQRPLIPKFYGHTESDLTIPLTSDMGKGYYRYIAPGRNLEMYISDVIYEEDTELTEVAERDAFSVSFCLSEELEWQSDFDREHILLHEGECMIYQSGEFRMKNFYRKNVRYVGVGLNIYPKRFPSVTAEFMERNLAVNPSAPAKVVPKFHVTRNIETILHQIITCNYDETLKSVYLEGKFLELIASFTHEVLQGKTTEAAEGKHTLVEDITLERVRTLIHDHLENPLTISELAKECFLSESKLRQIFRSEYGTTIYQYTLDCRMEWARELFDDYSFSIKEVSAMVGYTNMSHFSAAFKSRHGVTPKQYVKGKAK